MALSPVFQVANTAPTGADKTVTIGSDRAYTFEADDFGFADDDADTLASVRIESLPRAGALALGGTPVSLSDVVTRADIDADRFTFTPAPGGSGDATVSFTFKVNDGTDFSAGASTITFNVTDLSCVAPDFAGDGRRELWTGIVTVGEITFGGDIVAYGYDSSGGALDDTTFAIGRNSYTVDAAVVLSMDPQAGNPTFSLVGFDQDNLTAGEVAALRLHVCDTVSYDFSAATVDTLVASYDWDDSLDWSPPVASRTLYLSLPANRDATGAPTITGTARSGQELTAGVTGITDADGLTGDLSTLTDNGNPGGVEFSYQWLQVDADGSSNPADISGATESTYTLTGADVGKKIKVKVSFTDDLNGVEEPTSEAYPASGTVIAANVAPTVATVIPDQTATAGTVFNYAFPANTFADTNTGDTLTYTATQSDDSALPSWLSFDAATRTFSGTPAATDVETVSVKVTASDGNGGTVSDVFDIVVSANTDPTVANAILDQPATVGTVFSFAFPANTFADADGNTLTYTATQSDDSVLPSWLSFDAATRAFSGTPVAADVETVSVKVTASDGNGGSVSDIFDIVVSPPADTTVPTVTSIVRRTPTSSPTNADSLTWRVTFSEDVKNVDAADFAITGTTATVTDVTEATASTVYDVTASGGDLASLDATVTLSFASDQDIADTSDNNLSDTAPTGTNDNSYVVDTTAPTVASIVRRTPTSSPTNADSLTWRVTFSEDVQNVDAADFAIAGTTLTVTEATASTVYDVTASGGNLASLDATVTLSFASGQDIADTSDNALSNTAPTGTNDNSYVVDNTAPTVASIVRQTPTSSPTNADSLIWRVTFSEDVQNVDAADFAIAGTTASVTDVTVTTASTVYDVTASGGNLASLDATVTLSFAGGQDIADTSDNVLSDTAPAGTNDDTWVVDNTAPTVASIVRQTPTSSPTNADSLTWRVTFSEDVKNVDAADFAIGGTTATVTDVTEATASTVYDVTASGGNLASLDATVTLSFAGGQDIADTSDNVLSDTAPTGTNDDTYVVNNTAPTVASIVRQTPSSSPTNADSLTWRVTFSENVKNVDATDFAIIGTTATVTDVTEATASTVYDVTASGGNLADLDATATLSFAGGQNIADNADTVASIVRQTPSRRRPTRTA